MMVHRMNASIVHKNSQDTTTIIIIATRIVHGQNESMAFIRTTCGNSNPQTATGISAHGKNNATVTR